MEINTRFQEQAAKIILDLLSQNKIKVRELHVDFDYKHVDRFQLLSVETPEEICILQQMFFLETGEKVLDIFIKGRTQNWNDKVVQGLIKAVIEKTKKTPDIIITDEHIKPLFC